MTGAIRMLRGQRERAKQQAKATLGTLRAQVETALAALETDAAVKVTLFNVALVADVIGRYNLSVELISHLQQPEE